MIPPAELEALQERYALEPPSPWDEPPWRVQRKQIYLSFVQTCANWLDANFDAVLAIANDAPVNYSPMLDSAHGWTALCEYVALSLGIDAEPLFPTIH